MDWNHDSKRVLKGGFSVQNDLSFFYPHPDFSFPATTDNSFGQDFRQKLQARLVEGFFSLVNDCECIGTAIVNVQPLSSFQGQ